MKTVCLSQNTSSVCTEFPSMTILITPRWILIAAGIAIFGGLLGASYPAWIASRKDPVEALAYE